MAFLAPWCAGVDENLLRQLGASAEAGGDGGVAIDPAHYLRVSVAGAVILLPSVYWHTVGKNAPSCAARQDSQNGRSVAPGQPSSGSG